MLTASAADDQNLHAISFRAFEKSGSRMLEYAAILLGRPGRIKTEYSPAGLTQWLLKMDCRKAAGSLDAEGRTLFRTSRRIDDRERSESSFSAAD
jgi:hypothetical protein